MGIPLVDLVDVTFANDSNPTLYLQLFYGKRLLLHRFPANIRAEWIFKADRDLRNRIILAAMRYCCTDTGMSFNNWYLIEELTDEEREEQKKRHPGLKSTIEYLELDKKRKQQNRETIHNLTHLSLKTHQFLHSDWRGIVKLKQPDVTQMTDDELKQLKKMVNAEQKKRKEMK